MKLNFAKIIQEGINEILKSLDAPFELIVFNNVGTYQKNQSKPFSREKELVLVNAVAKRLSSDPVPAMGLKNFPVRLGFAAAVPRQYVNGFVGVLERYAAQKIGAIDDNTTYVFSMSLPSVGDLEFSSGIGEWQEVSSVMQFNIFTDGIMYGGGEHYLDGKKLITLNFGMPVKTSQTADPTAGEYHIGTANLHRQWAITLYLPYKLEYAPLVKMAFAKTVPDPAMTYTYDDGLVSFSKKVVLSSAQLNGEAGKIGLIELTLTEANPDIYTEQTVEDVWSTE